MGVLQGLDADVWVTGTPSVSIASTPDYCTNVDSGVYKRYRTSTHFYWDKTQPLIIRIGTNEKQSLAVTGSPTGGTVKLAFNGQTMAGTLPYNATAAQVKTALEGLSTIGANNTICTGGPWPGTAIVVEFVLAHSGENEPLISLNTNALTPSGNMTFTETQAGVAWADAPATTTFEYPGGYVNFVSALTSIQNVRVSAGYYFPVAQLANCHNWELDMKANTIDTSVFQQSSWGAYQAAMKTASGKIDTFISDSTLDGSLAQLMVFVLYLQKTTNLRVECYGWLSGESIKNAMSGVIEKGVTFNTDGAVYYRTVA